MTTYVTTLTVSTTTAVLFAALWMVLGMLVGYTWCAARHSPAKSSVVFFSLWRAGLQALRKNATHAIQRKKYAWQMHD